jgi:tripartite-type tricarboxylate transporter receptor subunit TctC
MPRVKSLFFIGLVLILTLALLNPAMAEDYPTKPVSLIVAYSPGGATDFQARIVTMLAGKEDYLGQPIVIINKPGAGGQVGWNWFVEKGTKDGYTMAAYNVPHFIAQSIVFPTKYDINKFEPVANWGADPAVLIVPKDSEFNSVEDMIKYAEKNPGKVTMTGAGLYVGHHIAFLQFSKATGAKFTYIPEKGGVPAMQSVVAGKVKAGFNNLSDAYRNKDRIKILAVADLERHEFLPDVKTFKEMGIDVDDSSVNFRGVALPKGAPKEAIEQCAKIFPEMFKAGKTLKKMKASGSPVRVLKRDEVIKMFKEREDYLKELLAELKKK